MVNGNIGEVLAAGVMVVVETKRTSITKNISIGNVVWWESRRKGAVVQLLLMVGGK